MSRPVVAAFAMPDRGHFQRLRPVVADLARRGATVLVFTHASFAADVALDGGEFVDLFAGREIDQPDDDSWPPAIRYVTFAAVHAPAVRDELAARRVSLVLYDTFAVIGAFAAQLLRIPRVNVCAGHAVVPERFIEVLRAHPWMRVSAACERALSEFQSTYSVGVVSPFSYVTALSPDLNVYSEPPQFLPAADRVHFEPVAFYGSLASARAEGPDAVTRRHAAERCYGRGGDETLKIFASFGTAIWAWRTAEAVRALSVVSEWASTRPNVRVLMTLGGAPKDGGVDALSRANVRVAEYVDQWEALAGADLFLTHHGLNSTHEAIACQAPMVSYPFIWDQPGLAARCHELGLAVPLVETPMAPPTMAQYESAIEQVVDRRPSIARALADARRWELEVVKARPSVIDRILKLA